jgi:predicted nucleic acid-binding protein
MTDTTFVVVDASVWVARLVPQDLFHLAARAWMDRLLANDGQMLSPSLLLSEVAGAIARRSGEPRLARQAIQQLGQLPGLQLVQMDQGLVQSAAFLAADLGLRGADALYAAVAAELDLPLVTLDADQRQGVSGRIVILEL